MSSFKWTSIKKADLPYLKDLDHLLDQKLDLFVENSWNSRFKRADFDGLISLSTKVAGLNLGILYSDFRILGGSMGKNISLRIREFISHMESRGQPIAFFINILGVRITEGRTVVKQAFSLIPMLKNFSEQQLLITVANGNSLGLGAILFRLGTYRIGVSEKSQINLTGPQVIKIFFGGNFDFSYHASPEFQASKRGLVQETLPDLGRVCRRIYSIMSFLSPGRYLEKIYTPSLDHHVRQAKKFKKSHQLLELITVLGASYEILEQGDQVIRYFICKRNSNTFAILANDPENPNNMLNVSTLQKYTQALAIFRAMGLPLLTLADTPGCDPRDINACESLVEELIGASCEFYAYPFKTLGIVFQRCFGGASVLFLPTILGKDYALAIKGAEMGIMHKKILAEVLGKSPKMYKQWLINSEKETNDCQDLIAEGIINKVIDIKQMAFEVDTHLLNRNPLIKLQIPSSIPLR